MYNTRVNILLIFTFLIYPALKSDINTGLLKEKPIDTFNYSTSQEELDNILKTQKLEAIDREIVISKNNQFVLNVVIISSLLAVLMIFIFLRQLHRRRKNRIQMLNLETDLLIKELELLQLQNDTALNSIELSRRIQTQIHQVIEHLKKPSVAKFPEVISIRQNLERLIEIPLNTSSDFTASETDLQNLEQLNNRFPVLRELNDTVKLILLLSAQDHSPKEIAIQLNLNVQYVRNVRSKIKSLLNLSNEDSWAWKNVLSIDNTTL